MRLAFSTLGVPGLPVREVATLAARNGFHGVELRASPEEPVHVGLDASGRAAAAAGFADQGIAVANIASYVTVAAPGPDEPVISELRAHLALAADLGAPAVRVFPGAGSVEDDEGAEDSREADTAAARRLAAVAAEATDRGVRLLLETHDSHRAGADVARVLGLVGHPAVGALWDVMHTWLAGETPEAAYLALAPYLDTVQVKDIASRTDTVPLALGAGVLPLPDVIEELSRAGWDGWISWEYEKRWYPRAAELPELLPEGHAYLLRQLAESA
jgi:sugar phosphate isomerase/epimerase